MKKNIKKHIDFFKPYLPSKTISNINKLSLKILESGNLIQGKYIKEFEKKIAEVTGAKYCVAVSSGTAALILAIAALDLKEYDEIIVPSYTFIATANSIVINACKPVFADVKLNTANIDENSIEKLITKNTKAIMTVDQFGNPANLKAIKKIADKYNLKVIEDAACALGSKYENENIGNCKYSNITCFSFHPRKIITTGEGGVITTNNFKIYKKLIGLRSHCIEENYKYVGYNFRMTEIQAAVGIEQLKLLKEIIIKRKKMADIYKHRLKDYVSFQDCETNAETNFQSFYIYHQDNKIINKIKDTLSENNIQFRNGIQNINLTNAYKRLYYIKLKNSFSLEKNSILLPLHSKLLFDDIDYICDVIINIFKN